MSPKEALIYHFTSVFPILGGLDLGFVFVWKLLSFVLCGFLAWRNPIRYFWGGLFMFGLLPVFVLVDKSDPVSRLVHFYLLWMSAEGTDRSLAVDPEARVVGWWFFPMAAILLL